MPRCLPPLQRGGAGGGSSLSKGPDHAEARDGKLMSAEQIVKTRGGPLPLAETYAEGGVFFKLLMSSVTGSSSAPAIGITSPSVRRPLLDRDHVARVRRARLPGRVLAGRSPL